MKTNLDLSERQFLEQLHRLGAGTVQEIGEAIGVTATAVRQRLNRLQALGLVSRSIQRAGRGRPHHIYEVTEKGLRSLGDNYGFLALILWREIKNLPDPAVREELMNRIRDAMVARFGNVDRSGDLALRMRQFKEEMLERGFDVDVDTSGELPILREHSCPYSELAGSDREICELEQDVFQRVLGVPMRLAQCCQDAHHCCEFEVGVMEPSGQEVGGA